jgi:hypothetical protein
MRDYVMFNAFFQSCYKAIDKIWLYQFWVIHLHQCHHLFKLEHIISDISGLFEVVETLEGAVSTMAG